MRNLLVNYGITTAWLLLFALAVTPSRPAFAVDGRVDLWGDWQSGGAGVSSYSTRTFLEDYRLGERVTPAKGLQVFANLGYQRRQLSSTSLGVTADSRTETITPNLGLSFRSRHVRAGVNAVAVRRDLWDFADQSTRDEHVNLNAWIRGDRDWGKLELRAQETAAWRESGGAYRESREHVQSARLTLSPTRGEEVRYRFEHRDQTVATSDRQYEQFSHEVYFDSNRRFADGRGHYAFNARGGLFEQTSLQSGSGDLVLVPPIWGGVLLDDTPEYHDTLEPDADPVPGLYDRDLDTPTVINIGDNAPVVRQYGGDYRNIIFDFGEFETVTQMVLYVDRVIRFPQLMQWQIHVSDDPEGRDWGQPLAASLVSVRYEELENGRQGWVVTFSQPVSHPRIKMVNSKLGETEPDIYVTEMEVLQPVVGGADTETTETVRRYRVRGDLGFDVTQDLEVHYYGNLYGRSYDTGGRDTDGQSHLVGASLDVGGWRLAASGQVASERRASGTDADVRTQRASMASRRDARLRGLVAWSRVDDRSFTLQSITNSVSGDVTWDIAPRLTVVQKVAYANRDTRDDLPAAESWITATEVRGAPRPNLDLTLTRVDRWVSREAGPGFSTYNDTELSSIWAIVPLVTLVSQVVYQVREDDDILLRNTLSWTPLPGGSMNLRLYALDYQDTRTDYFQRGGGVDATWKARPRLRLQGGWETTLLKQGGERNTPETWNVRGTWTF
jgi:hypothetical protein